MTSALWVDVENEFHDLLEEATLLARADDAAKGGRMGKSVDELMALPFGGRSVAENIDRAVARGALIHGEGGTFSLPATSSRANSNWAKVIKRAPLGCNFLMNVVFEAAYARSAVPHGCFSCFKVKVEFKTLRELVAGWGIAKGHEFTSKWGIDFYNDLSQAIYAGYYYLPSLEAARRHYWRVREAYAREPKLGEDVVLSIKRGCSEYEAALGPSNQYAFTEDQAEIEALLKARYRETPDVDQVGPLPLPLAHWIKFAFRWGDDTYLDFTNGQRFKPQTLKYDPGEPPTSRAE